VTTMTDAEWRESYAKTHAHGEVGLLQGKAAPAQPDAASEAASTERTPLWVGLLRLGLAGAAVATGSPWALPIVLWILLAHVLLED
jgi:hypothetical protein